MKIGLFAPIQALQGTPILCELGVVNCQINAVSGDCCCTFEHDGQCTESNGIFRSSQGASPKSAPDGCFCHRPSEPQHIEQRLLDHFEVEIFIADLLISGQQVDLADCNLLNICSPLRIRPKTAQQICVALYVFDRRQQTTAVIYEWTSTIIAVDTTQHQHSDHV